MVLLWTSQSIELLKSSMYSAAERENAKSAIPSTVPRPSRWFNTDHDRGQILSFSSPSRNHVERWSVVMSRTMNNTFLYDVLYKPMCIKYLDCIKFTLKNQCKCGHFLLHVDLIRNVYGRKERSYPVINFKCVVVLFDITQSILTLE